MKKQPSKKVPWFIWLSFLGLSFLHGKYSFHYTASRTKFEDENLNQYLGYAGRFLGMFFGVFLIPVLLMLHFLDRLPEPWYTIWNCVILAYTYFAGVFITWRLYCYLNHGRA